MKRIELKGRKSSKYLITLLTALTLIFLGGVDKANAQWTTPDASGNTNYPNGNVGINTGTTGPSRLLTISHATLPIIGFNETGAGTDAKRWVQFAYGGSFYFQTVNDADNSGQTWMQVNRLGLNVSNISFPNGNIGIGTTSPGYKLQTAGTAAFGTGGAGTNGSRMFLDAVNFNSTLDLSLQGANVYYSGTTRTRRETTLSGWSWQYNTATTDASSSAGLNYINPSGTETTAIIGIEGAAAANSLYIKAGGKVGIGTTNPQAALDVQGNLNVSGPSGSGNITVSGNIAAKYQDVAEWVPSAHALAAGTVVILNPNQSNQVMASSKSYDTRVAGVVSERPGLALGESGKDKVLVATTGRVKVKVDATRAPIHVGDLLVTSDVEGVAMKSEPVDLGGVKLHRPGTLIGKALENLEKGAGEILVLLSLQ